MSNHRLSGKERNGRECTTYHSSFSSLASGDYQWWTISKIFKKLLQHEPSLNNIYKSDDDKWWTKWEGEKHGFLKMTTYLQHEEQNTYLLLLSLKERFFLFTLYVRLNNQTGIHVPLFLLKKYYITTIGRLVDTGK